ncbi:hypothetical protein [Planctomyces sp. SH-PL14]|uniref:hypothetical protein n=1 Tax=Planctomyces sp. SH-PL14 TaxID=1632864 RepID=UPI00078B74B9|nr:hypothetical protein [Planctomyces sp. SH-PL14]AMV20099.1 hypothetical protein VT03_19545 [Planctomyces sp. SH-PL14]
MKTASLVIAWTQNRHEMDNLLELGASWGIDDELWASKREHKGVPFLTLSLPEGDERRRRFIMRLRQEPGLWRVEFRPHVPYWQTGDEQFLRRRGARHAIR